MSNTIGNLFRLTTFGESHGIAIGGIIDGCPAGLTIDFNFIQDELDKRKPGQSAVTTQRNEDDKVEFLSGIFEGKTLGTPIGFIVKNKDFNSDDYAHLKNAYRPSHADYTYQTKYGIRDYRGGGRASVRDSVSWVVAGAIAKQLLKTINVKINAYAIQVGDVKLLKNYKSLDFSKTYLNAARCPDELIAQTMISRIEQVKKEGDTLGGIVSCVILGAPAGLGEPVFNKLHASLGKAMLSINSVKGFDYGSGFDGVEMKGSEHNDKFISNQDKISTESNYSGGIQGGISNGEDIYFRVAFKPVSTIMKTQQSVNDKGETIKLEGKGRHDSCVVPRAVPIVEAMAALVMADFLLMNKINKI